MRLLNLSEKFCSLQNNVYLCQHVEANVFVVLDLLLAAHSVASAGVVGPLERSDGTCGGERNGAQPLECDGGAVLCRRLHP